jgi:hypothetical protein
MSFPKKAHRPIMQITNSSVGPMEQKYIEWTFLKLPNVGYLPCSEYRLIQNIDVRIVILFKRKKNHHQYRQANSKDPCIAEQYSQDNQTSKDPCITYNSLDQYYSKTMRLNS